MAQMESSWGPYLVQLPIYLVWLVGAYLAVTRRRRQPRVSLLALIALVIFFLQSLVGTFLSTWLPYLLHVRGMSVNEFSNWILVNGLLQALISTVAWGLLLAALFGRRSEPAAPAPA